MTKQILLSGRPCSPFCDFFPPSNHLFCISYYLLLAFIVNLTPNSTSNISNFCQDTQHLRRSRFLLRGKPATHLRWRLCFAPSIPCCLSPSCSSSFLSSTVFFLICVEPTLQELPEKWSGVGGNSSSTPGEMVWRRRELLVPCMSENIFGPPKQLADSSVFREF